MTARRHHDKAQDQRHVSMLSDVSIVLMSLIHPRCHQCAPRIDDSAADHETSDLSTDR